MAEALVPLVIDLLRDRWSLTLRDLQHHTGIPRKTLQKCLNQLLDQQQIVLKDGRYAPATH